MLQEWSIPAHFTNSGYLSMNRSHMDKFLKSGENAYIVVDGIKFDMKKLSKCVTYNEHKNVLRWNKPDMKKCIIKD